MNESRGDAKCLFMAVLLAVAALAYSHRGNCEEAGEDARMMHRKGVELFKQSRYEEAAVAFRKAHQLRPTWKLLFNIGQCEAAAKRYGLALEAFEKYLVEGGDDVPDERREYVATELRRIRPLVGVLEVEADYGIEVLVDGTVRAVTPLEGPLRVAAGTRQVVLRRGGEIVLEKKVQLAGGMTTRIEPPREEGGEAEEQEPLQPEADDEKAASPLTTVGWIGVGVGAAVAISGAITGGMAMGKSNELADKCPEKESCSDEYESLPGEAEKLALTTNILLPVGAVLAATGVVLIIVGRTRGDSEEPKVSLLPITGPNHAGFAVQGEF